MHYKLKQVMLERDHANLLGGIIQLDDAYLGAQRSDGRRGHGTDARTPFVAAVDLREISVSKWGLGPVGGF